jgi:hypothetical protein
MIKSLLSCIELNFRQSLPEFGRPLCAVSRRAARASIGESAVRFCRHHITVHCGIFCNHCDRANPLSRPALFSLWGQFSLDRAPPTPAIFCCASVPTEWRLTARGLPSLRSFFPIQPNVQPSGLNWTDLDTLSGHMAATVGNGGIVEWSSS